MLLLLQNGFAIAQAAIALPTSLLCIEVISVRNQAAQQ